MWFNASVYFYLICLNIIYITYILLGNLTCKYAFEWKCIKTGDIYLWFTTFLVVNCIFVLFNLLIRISWSVIYQIINYDIIWSCFMCFSELFEHCIDILLISSYFFTGWLTVLSKWICSKDLVLSLHAARALANLDRDYVSCIYEDGVHLIHPIFREK